MIRWFCVLIIFPLILPVSTLAVVETYQFSDPALELRYRQLSAELRCPKCQNQNIAESNAPISKDLRRILYEQLEAGSSDQEILDYMSLRYGEFVRYRPVFSPETAALWIAPIAFLLFGLGFLWFVLKRGVGNAGKRTDPSSASEELEEFFAKDNGRS